ncbi:MAG TPA: MFS transporter [Verrucomicrobiota bacterium]|jgi:ACS family hexuronate transporter-like MFS transporter|nr:MFS transporter [Verrucomicrobiota bacterium]OQC26817.1 MAG: Hexuronate transporter [Verrucomicrobia bacterium ADurb.Bin063]HRR65533.1 MFS transporter [Candidatus Paceibacterota bacterium]MBP8013883.1 MFS transporter [Verrucomicrobiota bacterium]NLH84824.1 MFS transporter [Verrucomicrobiota bacterium]
MKEGLLSPRRRRWIILVLIFGGIVLNYFDRQIIAILKPTIKAQFHLDDAGYALLTNIFTVCYAGMYPLAGWLVDRWGAGSMMLAGLLAWSSACLGTGLTRTFGQLAFCRGMLGLAEPVAFPAQLRAVTLWFPGSLRATANSLCVAGSSIGAIAAPPLVAWLALKWSWQAAFIIPGAIGLGLAGLWRLLYRDPPAEMMNPVADAAEPGPAEKFAWPQLWRTRSLWGIVLIRFISDPVWYFCLFWLPGYLQEQSGLTLAQTGQVGWIPFLAGGLGGVGSAAWSDWMVKRGLPPVRARKLMLTSMAALGPVCALTPHLPNAAATLAIFSIASAVCLSWLYSLSVVIAEAFPTDNIGSVLGIAAGFGAAGAMLFNYFVGQVMGTLGAANMFIIMALLHPLAALVLWTMVRREQPKRRATPGPGR